MLTQLSFTFRDIDPQTLLLSATKLVIGIFLEQNSLYIYIHMASKL